MNDLFANDFPVLLDSVVTVKTRRSSLRVRRYSMSVVTQTSREAFPTHGTLAGLPQAMTVREVAVTDSEDRSI